MTSTTHQQAPAITVLGLGDDDWTMEADGEAREGADAARGWERYGTVSVRIGDVVYEVGAVIGVPDSLRGTARAAGGDTITPYLDAWYADASDWANAPGSDGSAGDTDVLAVLNRWRESGHWRRIAARVWPRHPGPRKPRGRPRKRRGGRPARAPRGLP